MQYPCGWVSPFGHCRIKACCQLPDTFRRLPRPSSPLTAKASTVCAYSLDHITPSRLGITSLRIQTTNHFKCWNAFRHSTLALPNAWILIQTLVYYVPNCQRTRHRLQRQAASNLYVCAQNHPEFRLRVSLGGGSGRTRTTGLTLIRGCLLYTSPSPRDS